MKPRLIQEEFMRLCKEYSMQPDLLGTTQNRDKTGIVFSLVFHNVKLDLVYRIKASAGVPPSVLYCRVYPNKNSPVYLHLPQLLPLLGMDDFRACYFPYIETTQRMQACFQNLTDFIDAVLPTLKHTAAKGNEQTLLHRHIGCIANDMQPEAILSNGTPEQEGFLMIQKVQDTGFIARFTEWGPWKDYIMGFPEKALIKYRKQKDLLPYEQKLCAFISTSEGQTFVPMPPDCCAQKDMLAVTSGKDDGGTLFKGMLYLYLVLSPIACLLILLFQLISAYGTLCWLGPPWYMGFLIAGLPSLFGGIAFRRKLIPFINRKTAKKQLDFDDIVNSSAGVDLFAKIVFIIATICSLVFGALMATETVRLYDNYVEYPTSLLRKKTFTYSQIEAVYYIESRYNDYDERINRDSYVIALDNGYLLDLDGYTSVKKTEQKVLPILKKHGIQIIPLDSDRDLPQP